jgi:heme ABC exporter ATP-binding subunit CcmA
MQGAVVELRNVTKRYGAVRAVMGVSARFESGRITVVRGPNGSGKSTLLGIVGTLVKPTSGEVDHGALGSSRAAVRGALGWVGHESLCYPDLTGRRNIELAARLHGIDGRGAFARAAERFDLAAFADRPLRTYSRGQRQRIALARGLVHEPALLLLDEPATGLDAASTDRLRNVVREEATRGAIVIIVTHEDRLTEGLEVSVLSLERGRRVQAGEAAR